MTLLTEGLRAAPWFREMARRGQLGIDNCDRCKERTSATVRQTLGCGYEPDGKVHLQVWQPPQGKNGYRGEPLTKCAGYTANLPEVHESTLAWAHWSKGNAVVLGPLNKDALAAILVIEGQYSQLQSWLMTPAGDGGGGS